MATELALKELELALTELELAWSICWAEDLGYNLDIF